MDLKKLPKIDLHCHLDGSVRVETLYELLNEKKEIGEMSLEEFRDLASIRGECNSLIEYLERFSYPGKVMQTEENLERITYEALEDMARENVIYGELRFAPYLHMNEGLSFEQVLEAVIRGLNRAKEEFAIGANLILIGMRHENKDNTFSVVEKGRAYLGRGVVGFDIAGNEADFPPEIHEEAFKLAKEAGFKLTVHAGETGVVKNIYTALDLLKADRIGHGIAAIKDTDLMDRLARENIFLEMCPISNIQTKSVDSIELYPLKEFLDRGIKLTVNTDNRTVSNTTSTGEFEYLRKNISISDEDIIRITRNSIEAAFVGDEERKVLRAKLEEFLK